MSACVGECARGADGAAQANRAELAGDCAVDRFDFAAQVSE
jgi:hypothetical protein